MSTLNKSHTTGHGRVWRGIRSVLWTVATNPFPILFAALAIWALTHLGSALLGSETGHTWTLAESIECGVCVVVVSALVILALGHIAISLVSFARNNNKG